jgi:plastocyanin
MQRQAMRALIALVAACAVLIPAAAFGDGHGARSHSVVLRHNRFSPRRLAVPRGDSVTWLWRDGAVAHNVVSMRFGMSRVQSRGSFSVRFTRAGSYFYYCTIHAGMTGTIVVR